MHISYYENVWNTLKNIFNIFSPWDIHVLKKKKDLVNYCIDEKKKMNFHIKLTKIIKERNHFLMCDLFFGYSSTFSGFF